MLGAIIGDIAGSRFEFNNHKSKEFELFANDCRLTDDSIMTLAVAKAIMETDKIVQTVRHCGRDAEYCAVLQDMAVKYMQEIGRRYPHCGYGALFLRWLFSGAPEPYQSYGNGAAMRISPAGFSAVTEEEARTLSAAITGVTHNHPEGLKGAEAVSVAVFMARRGALKSEIRARLARYYTLNFKIDEIRNGYRFSAACQDSVPQALEAFLESVSFEDAVRTAVSLGGDSDTIAAIAGAVAEAYYGVPEHLRTRALTYLDVQLRTILGEWEVFTGRKGSQSTFKVLTKYIDRFSGMETSGAWVVDSDNDGTP